MVFNSFEFAFFLPLVFLIYWRVKRQQQNWLLLAASYVFYGWWDYRFLGLIIISTLVDFFLGLKIRATEVESRRRQFLSMSLVLNLGLLGAFKYAGFFVESGADLLRSLGLEPNPPLLRVIVPVGISFYTFQTISYTFDVFRRRIEPTRNLLDFAVYVAFFPQLVAGPIERARRLLPQIQSDRKLPHAADVGSGLLLIGMGLFKKVAIADVMAPIVDVAFATTGTASSLELLVGLYAFSLQIYGDFSGYSDIARGTSRLFGIELMRNFEQPYLSRNVTEFWRTWHVSLSTWLHDYLYIPLGGNRRGPRRTYLNLMIVMVLGGLWHGAAWTFVIWGAMHGIYLAIHRASGRYVPRGFQGRFSLSRDLLPTLATFHLVALAWIFFRAPDVQVAWSYILGLFSLRPGVPSFGWLALLLPAIAAIAILDIAQRNADDHEVVLSWRPAYQGIAYSSFVLGVILFSGGPTVPFIYFQF